MQNDCWNRDFANNDYKSNYRNEFDNDFVKYQQNCEKSTTKDKIIFFIVILLYSASIAFAFVKFVDSIDIVSTDTKVFSQKVENFVDID